jgi:peptidoglycan/LPS O-acetylase OafA/YrhL
MNEAQRIPSLDGLRAIAISLVIYWHLWLPKHLKEVGIDWGTLGVYIFFVLSGFLITGLMIRESERNGFVSLKNFYIRRFFRIIPPLLCLLLVVKILATIGLAHATNYNLLFNLTFFRNYRPGPLIFQHFWSLSVEEQFYLFWPFLFVRYSKRALTRMLLAVVVIVPIIRLIAILTIGDRHVADTEQVADGIAWGCLLAMKQSELRASRLYQWLARSYVALLLPVVMVAGAYVYPLTLDALVGKSAVFVCSALLIDILILRSDSAFGKIVNFAPLTWFGRISYSLYLWQQIFLFGFGEPYAWFPANICLALLCAIISYYFIEEPSIRWGRSIVGRRASSMSGVEVSPATGPAS